MRRLKRKQQSLEMVAPLTKEGNRLLMQSRRAMSLRDNAQSLRRCLDHNPDDPKIKTLRAHIKGNVAKIRRCTMDAGMFSISSTPPIPDLWLISSL